MNYISLLKIFFLIHTKYIYIYITHKLNNITNCNLRIRLFPINLHLLLCSSFISSPCLQRYTVPCILCFSFIAVFFYIKAYDKCIYAKTICCFICMFQSFIKMLSSNIVFWDFPFYLKIMFPRFIHVVVYIDYSFSVLYSILLCEYITILIDT